MSEKRMPQRVLVAVDSSEHSAYAVEFVLKNVCVPGMDTLVILHVHDVVLMDYPVATDFGVDFAIPPSIMEEVDKAAEKESQAVVSRFTEMATQKKVSSEAFFVTGDARSQIVEQAKKLHADLLVVGSRGIGALKRALLGSVSDHCLHHSSLPLLIVRQPSGAPEELSEAAFAESAKGRRILVAVDASEDARRALRWILDHYSRPNDEIAVISVLAPPPWAEFSEYYDQETIDRMEKSELEEVQAMMEACAEDVRLHGLQCTTNLLRGSIRTHIVSEADRIGAHVLAMGSRGMGPIKSLLIGSISEYCAHNANVPVLIVRPAPPKAADDSNLPPKDEETKKE